MILSLLVSMLASPAWAGAPEAAPEHAYIVNGEEIKANEYPAAVAIGFELPGYGRQATCSASLLTPRILITAAHCTAEFGIPEEQILAVGAGFIGAKVASDKTTLVRFKSIKHHPQYSTNPNTGGPVNDVNIIELEEPVVGITPVYYQDTALDDSKVIDAEVVSVGYGVTSSARSDQNSSGVKRSATLTIDQVDDQFLYSYAQTNDNRSNVCSGDSGGPQYHVNKDGTVVQWGVHSFVFGGQDPCLVASGTTNLSSFSSFIDKQIERVHGSTDRCDVMDLYNNRICDSVCDYPDEDCTIDEDGDGIVSDDEFAYYDRDGDGVVSDEEFENPGGCSSTGAAGFGWLPVFGLLALGFRRRD